MEVTFKYVDLIIGLSMHMTYPWNASLGRFKEYRGMEKKNRFKGKS